MRGPRQLMLLPALLASAHLLGCSKRTQQAQVQPQETAQHSPAPHKSNETNRPHDLLTLAERGDVRAQCGLADAIALTNAAEAMKWYTKAADGGDTEAQTALALLYYEGRGVEQDHVQAVKWFRKAADHESGRPAAFAQFALGRYYDFGGLAGIKSDCSQALRLYNQAAKQGLAEAQYSLGQLYINGRGVPKDWVEAAKWHRKAAEQGYTKAQIALCAQYAFGMGVPEDDVEAYQWINLATAADPSCATTRQTLARSMTPAQVAEGQRRSSAFRPRKENPDFESNRADFHRLVPKSSGSGFFVSEDGYLLTCAHVIDGADRIEIVVGSKQYPATLIKTDKANDVALLKAALSCKALPLAQSRATKLGDSVFTIGFPNIAIQGYEPKLTRGEVNALSGIQDDPRYFQISVPVQPGNSGGPLLDLAGNVVGIISSRLSDIEALRISGSLPQNVNYALKSSFITAFLETVPEIKLKAVNPAKDNPFAQIAETARRAIVMVNAY